MGSDTLSNNAFQVLNDIKANNEQALQHLYRSNFDKVETFILNNQGNADDARDIYQEAFIVVWRNIQLNRFQPENDYSLSGYLYRIAKNKWIDHLRSRKSKKTMLVGEETVFEQVEDLPAAEHDFLEKVTQKMQEMGENCKSILSRFYYGKQSLRQIAEVMGWTEATARNNKYRCIEKLRALLTSK